MSWSTRLAALDAAILGRVAMSPPDSGIAQSNVTPDSVAPHSSRPDAPWTASLPFAVEHYAQAFDESAADAGILQGAWPRRRIFTWREAMSDEKAVFVVSMQRGRPSANSPRARLTLHKTDSGTQASIEVLPWRRAWALRYGIVTAACLIADTALAGHLLPKVGAWTAAGAIAVRLLQVLVVRPLTFANELDRRVFQSLELYLEPFTLDRVEAGSARTTLRP